MRGSSKTQDYVPSPYVPFRAFWRRSYASLYPHLKNDEELKRVVADCLAKCEATIAKHIDAPHPGHGSAPPFSDTYIARSHAQQDKLLCDFVAKAIEAEDFDVFRAIKGAIVNSAPSGQISYQNWQRSHQIPGAISVLLIGRKAKCWAKVRDALFQGGLKAFYADPSQGILEFPNRNIWLDDNIAAQAKAVGIAKLYPPGSLGSLSFNPDFPILLEEENLASVFPPQTPVASTHTKGTQRDRIVAALRELNLERTGDSERGDIKAAKIAVEDHIGEPFSDEQFRLARKQASEKG